MIFITEISLGNSGNTLRYPNYLKFAILFVFYHMLLVEQLKLSFSSARWTNDYNISFSTNCCWNSTQNVGEIMYKLLLKFAYFADAEIMYSHLFTRCRNFWQYFLGLISDSYFHYLDFELPD
jgi:hypothetical protein